MEIETVGGIDDHQCPRKFRSDPSQGSSHRGVHMDDVKAFSPHQLIEPEQRSKVGERRNRPFYLHSMDDITSILHITEVLS
jgi:hypothetical protein